MTDDLAQRTCVPCRGDSPAVPDAEWTGLLARLPGWEVAREHDVPMLVKTFRVADFAQALAFAVAVGELAEAEDHHPRLVVEYGRVAVAWWTHAIGGLHHNDFILAARTEAAAPAS